MRLDQYLAKAAGLSRSTAKAAVRQGKVKINGSLCKAADTALSPSDEVMLEGRVLSWKEFVYVMLDKPAGVLSASKDAKEHTVVDLVAKDYPGRALFPAGRLDKQSTGFILLTDDGALAHDLLSPKKHVEKTYEVVLDTPVTEEMVQGFAQGVTLADGETMKPAELRMDSERPCFARVILTQGVYHQIKRMFGVYGAGVNELRRTAIGGVVLDKALGEGGFRELTQAELSLLKREEAAKSCEKKM